MTRQRPKAARSHAADLRGAARLLVHATKRVTEVVQSMHVTIAGGPDVLGRPLEAPARAMTGVVYASIRGVTHAVGAALDVALEQLAPLLGASAPGPERAAALAALNGVVGDHLAQTGNALATEAALFVGPARAPLATEPAALKGALVLAGATGKLVVLVHGSSMSEAQWTRAGHDHGARLAADLGYTPVYARYNSGLHVSTNGRALDGLLEPLVRAWPVALEELVLLGHSMGGLVARSACIAAEASPEPRAWRAKLTRLVCLGTPHHGAPLERGGNWAGVLLGVSRYSAPLARLARLRSAGVTDLRFGYVRDEDWEGRDRFARGADQRRPASLPAGVRAYAIAGSKAPAVAAPGDARPLAGDGLVPVESALGHHPDPAKALAFPPEHAWVARGTGHLDLLSDAEVYAKIRGWLAEA